MAYGLKYTCDFTRLENSLTSEYTLEIYQKDYSGSVTEITGGVNVCIHSWDTDEPTAPIKGSSLVANLLNESGNISLRDLYSTNDDEFKGKLIWDTDKTLFEGFLVQEDSRELMVDFTHGISLSFTDNLGLLKEIPFDKARFQQYTEFDGETVTIEGVAPHTLIITDIDKILTEGDLISTTGTLAGVYHIRYVSGSEVIVEETVTTEAPESVTMVWFKKDFFTLRSLLSVIHSCLSSTSLEIPTRIFANIHEANHDTSESFLSQTLIDPQTFFNGSEWENCYDVLTKILEPLGFTLCQSFGKWQIIRWAEARNYDYAVPGFEFDENFENPTEVTLDEDGKFIIGIGEDCVAETGLEEGITRPYKFVRETFNYKLPSELLRNANLEQLGDLITTYTDGSNTVYEYEFTWWEYTDAAPTPSGVNGAAEFFIRVVQDSLGNEIQRYVVLKNNHIHSYPIQAQTGDIAKFSCSVLQSDNFTTLAWFFKLTDGVDTVYAQLKGTSPGWDTTTGSFPVVVTGSEWSSIDIELPPIPFDGLLTVYLHSFGSPASQEHSYRDIRLEYTPMINQSTKIIGHTHTAEQGTLTKNINEKEIFIDDSPRSAVAGTLFLDSLTGVLQDRTTIWARDGETEFRKLGDIITFENEFLRSISRTLLEGDFYGLQSPAHVSMISLIRYTLFATHNFIFGRLEIDYRNNKFTATLYEMYKDTEADTDLVYNYIFKYLYATK